MSCINKNDPKFQELLGKYKNPLIAEVKYKQLYPDNHKQVNYEFKAITNIIPNLTRVNQWFKQLGNTDKFWQKLQQDLQIPKKQIELLKNSEGNTIEEKLSSFAANYSYTVEINTAKERSEKNDIRDREFEVIYGYKKGSFEEFIRNKFRGEKEEFIKTQIDKDSKSLYYNEYQERQELVNNINTSHHSNLTVPGGTNYTENAITIPGVINVISAGGGYHDNEFNESKGDMAGWFRSDDESSANKFGIDVSEYEKLSKTRRILEVQSFFQKVRDSNYLIFNLEHTIEELGPYSPKSMINSNNFLQLLNKDNNWVTFFVKSIIQDSAKKGYEKVIFATTDTAAKVEGMQSLKEFKKQKEDRIKELEKTDNTLEEKSYELKGNDSFTVNGITYTAGAWLHVYHKNNDIGHIGQFHKTRTSLTKEQIHKAFDSFGLPRLKEVKRHNEELERLKQELERVEKEGMGAIYKAIAKYDNEIPNILKKQGYNPTLITDEYGNTWNEIEIKPEFKGQPILFQNQSSEGIIASEKTIRDLAARLSDRIGIPFRFESDRSKEYKGKIENGIAYINLAYATLDTPIHEILGHPIIRAIKDKKYFDGSIDKYNDAMVEFLDKNPNATRADAIAYADKKVGNNQTDLYKNLLKELETGKGKEVLDRIKRDYVSKESKYPILERIGKVPYGGIYEKDGTIYSVNGKDFFEKNKAIEFQNNNLDYSKKYTLEEQQEEAIIELLGLMTAEKLDNVKDGKLISLLKRLLKEMKQFIRSLINQKEVEIDKLPDNMTINDLADLLAYSNSKLILPGYEVEYTTPDNEKFKTYQEASNHISQLFNESKDIDLDNAILNTIVQEETVESLTKANRIILDKVNVMEGVDYFRISIPELQYIESFSKEVDRNNSLNKNVKRLNEIKIRDNGLLNFIEKNKEYEQSKEIIEEWKKVNNIQYNPKEIYSRGQGFYSAFAAYSDLDLDTLMANILHHIEDNEKAGGKFALSAFTKPIDKTIRHIEKSGLNFVIFPQPEHIMWAANNDVFSGSVWDASEKVNKDKKSELLGVSYTKYPALHNINAVQPNLASVVDDLSHHHNELGIQITGNNFRLEINKEVLNETDGQEYYKVKAWVDKINKILDQKYGKLVKPEISKITTIPNTFEYWQQDMNEDGGMDRFKIKIYKKDNKWFEEFFDTYGQSESIREISYKEVETQFNEALASNSTLTRNKGIQPTQTKDNLKESIENVKNKTLSIFDNSKYVHPELGSMDGYNNFESDEFKLDADTFKLLYNVDKKTYNVVKKFPNYWQAVTKSNLEYYSNIKSVQVSKIIEEQKKLLNEKIEKFNKKEYISQALINTKIAALKEVAKKYPRSLIRSEVKKIGMSTSQELYDQFEGDELLFQKIPSKPIKEGVAEVFEQNPELVLIGTAQEYSDYLDTIFPDSKVKDIVYHGSNSKIEKFDTSKSKVSDVIYFSNDVKEATYYANKIPNDGIFVVGDYQYTYLRFENENYYLKKEVKIGKEKLSRQDAISKYSISEKEYKEAKSKLGNLNPSLINIKNLYQGFGEDLFFGGAESFKKDGYDGFITNNDAGQPSILAVFETEQIHILGSKQDIDKFKEYMDFKNNIKNYFNLTEEDSNFVQDISNLNFTC